MQNFKAFLNLFKGTKNFHRLPKIKKHFSISNSNENLQLKAEFKTNDSEEIGRIIEINRKK